MSLNHDFLLLDRKIDGEWALGRFHHDSRAIHLHDDFVRYMGDTLAWVPTVNPAVDAPTGHRQHGLCMWGSTLIEAEGAAVAAEIFRAWADLLTLGPPDLLLTGRFSWTDTDDELQAQDRATQLEGGYDRIELSRNSVVVVLNRLSVWCRQVATGGGRLCLYHGGV